MHKFISLPSSLNSPPLTMKSFFSRFSSLPKTPNPSYVFLNYLIESFNFSESQAIALSKKYHYVKSLDNPHNVCKFLQNIGFSEAQIQSTIRGAPGILVYDVDKILKPKIELFQNLGVEYSDLGKLISKNSLLLTRSLEKKLIPFIEILKQVLANDKNNENLIRSLGRCNLRLISIPESRLLSNIELFRSCGIVGSQLSTLLPNNPGLFAMPEFKLKELVSQLSDMGFSVKSRMFVHGLRSISTLSKETFERKLELFKSFGFSRDEFITMFRKAPMMLSMSEERLRSGLEFFLKKAELEKEMLLNYPVCLQFSLENRVIPRYRVFKIVSSRRLLKKDCTFRTVLVLTEEKFLQKFVWRFGDDAEELLLAYKDQNLGILSSSLSSSSKEKS